MLFLFQDGEGVPVVSLPEGYTPEKFAEKRGLKEDQYLLVDEIRGLPEKWELFPLGLTLDLNPDPNKKKLKPETQAR
jgi:hypothetical protein